MLAFKALDSALSNDIKKWFKDLLGETNVRSRGVAGWEPPIVCAKLLLAAPVCLDCCVFKGPGAPFAGPPNPQLVPLPNRIDTYQYISEKTENTIFWVS